MQYLLGLSALLSCLPAMAGSATLLEGTVIADTPLSGATVTVTDSRGKHLTTRTRSDGRYSPWRGYAPLTLSAGTTEWHIIVMFAQRCSPRPLHGFASAYPAKDRVNTANITPFTDRLVSEVAGGVGVYRPATVGGARRSRQTERRATGDAVGRGSAREWATLRQSGFDPDTLDPVTTPVHHDDGMTRILSVIHHNRNYDNNSGEAGSTVLTDSAFRPIVGLQNSGPWEPFDLRRALADRQAIRRAKTRILVVSDSTAATYEVSRLPRMGWGQVFQQQFRADSGVVVLNGARSGRSSRDFITKAGISRWRAICVRRLRVYRARA